MAAKRGSIGWLRAHLVAGVRAESGLPRAAQGSARRQGRVDSPGDRPARARRADPYARVAAAGAADRRDHHGRALGDLPRPGDAGQRGADRGVRAVHRAGRARRRDGHPARARAHRGRTPPSSPRRLLLPPDHAGLRGGRRARDRRRPDRRRRRSGRSTSPIGTTSRAPTRSPTSPSPSEGAPMDYTRQSPYSDPRAYAPLLAALPADLPELAAVIRNVLVHYRSAGIDFPGRAPAGDRQPLGGPDPRPRPAPLTRSHWPCRARSKNGSSAAAGTSPC